jgi:hypothetical protein
MPTSPDPLGKRALFWAPAERRDPDPLAPRANEPGRRALFSAPEPEPAVGDVLLDCSACHSRSRVSYVELARLHLPFWLWIPGRRYSRLLHCPACDRRTWVRVTFRRS